MKIRKPKILVITPIKHISNVFESLSSFAEIHILEDPSIEEIIDIIFLFDAIFTNPNKSNVYIGKAIIDAGRDNLKVICTASTGTVHIDKEYARNKGIKVISLTEERSIINKISSTAELSFALTLDAVRNITNSSISVQNDEWDYTRFIGRQMNSMTIGVIGFGRLGSFYSNYCKAFGAKVLIFDPYKKVEDEGLTQVNEIDELVIKSDVISLHVHVTSETLGMIDEKLIKLMKKDIILVNTSRGDIVNEKDLVNFLKKNPNAKVATDVLINEVTDRQNSPLLKYSKNSNQVLITPHIGGMTREAQELAYNHSVYLLKSFFIL